MYKFNQTRPQQDLQFSFKKESDLVKRLESCIDDVKRDLLASSPMNQNKAPNSNGNPMKT